MKRKPVKALLRFDSYPFGMLMPARQYYATNSYRYGFNGKENDNEVKGEGNQQDYGMRIYDPRLGRFLSVDPLMGSYPYYSPYQFAGNMPIWAIDLDGEEEKKSTEIKFDIGKILDESKIRDQVINVIYAAIDAKIPSKNEGHNITGTGPRGNDEEDVIKKEIGKYVIVDMEAKAAYIFDPQKQEPVVIFKIGKSLFEFALDESKPIFANAAGISSDAIGTTIVKVSENVESYTRKFYQKYFPKKYAAAIKISAGTNKALGKFLKGTGKVLKSGGKLLEIFGTAQIFMGVLDTSPGPIKDETLREITQEQIKKYILSLQNNSPNDPKVTPSPGTSNNTGTPNPDSKNKGGTGNNH